MDQVVTKAILKDTLDEAFTDFGAKIFQYFDQWTALLLADFENLRQDFRGLQASMDAHAKRMEVFEHESISRDAKTDRHERWIGQLADKTNLHLEY